MQEPKERPIPPTILALLRALHEERIRYVHWKSNINISRALAGNDDLDLLVHPDDAREFERIMYRLGFRRVLTYKDSWQPDMFHYYCADPSYGLIHLHLHYSLTLGHDFNKNYTLPITDWYLTARRLKSGIYLPDPAREYIIFVLRLLIKNSKAADVVEFPRRQAMRWQSKKHAHTISPSEIEELEFLVKGSAEDEVARALKESGLAIRPADLDAYAQALRANSNTVSIHRCARSAKRSLRVHRREPEIIATLHAMTRINGQRVRKILQPTGLASPPARQSAPGGRIIAFIGGDGAGKTTNVANLNNILARGFNTKTFHIGRPPRSAPGLALTVLARTASSLGWKDDALALRNLALAIGRRAEFERASRLRDRGGIAILDRIPHANISHMDAPRIRAPKTARQRLLARLEMRQYHHIGNIDQTIVLRLNPALAALRRPDDDPQALHARSSEVWEGDWTLPGTHAIDTGASDIAAVQAEVIAKVWAAISADRRVCELIGLSGAGKSTVSRLVATELPNTSLVLPYRKFPFALLRAGLRELITSGVPLTPLRLQLFKNMTQLRTFILMMHRPTRPSILRAHNYVLDQGPVFQLALGLKEGRITPDSKLFRQASSAIAAGLDRGVVILDASLDVLVERILRRSTEQPRASRLPRGELIEFLQTYEKCLGHALAAANCSAVHVDANQAARAVADQTLQVLKVHLDERDHSNG